VAKKLAELELAATVTDGATVNTEGALLARVTTVALVEDLDRVRVQAVLALEGSMGAAHCREEIEIEDGAVSEIVVGMDAPLKVAVRVAVWSEGTVPEVAVKVADAVLAGTVTDGATVNTAGTLLVRVTAVALAADLERVTVQVALALEARVAGAH
jgi:hypothetical protein